MEKLQNTNMFKLIQVSSTRSPLASSSSAAAALLNVRPFSSLSASSHKIFSPASLSVCGFCRVLQPNKAFNNCLVFLAMSNVCVSRFQCLCHKSGTLLSARRRCGNGFHRTFSTCTVPLISPTPSTPLIVSPPSSLSLAASVSQSDLAQRSDEWFAVRKDKLTTSSFSTALGFWKGNRRSELWHEKVFASEVQVVEGSRKFAMDWGVLNEAAAVDRYKNITGREVSSYGFAIHSGERLDWLGASPDGLLGCFPGGGILEVKCPYNKGKPETALPWSTVPFYYMPQVQGQLEIMDREWADLYCWTPNGSTIFRVHRERDYWQLIHGVLHEFWWENVIPAREALLLGQEEEVKSYRPTSTHKLTGHAIFRSIKLANESKLLCREIAGHVEFYRR